MILPDFALYFSITKLETAIFATILVGFGRMIACSIDLVHCQIAADDESDVTTGSDAVDLERSKSGFFLSFIAVRNKHSGLCKIQLSMSWSGPNRTPMPKPPVEGLAPRHRQTDLKPEVLFLVTRADRLSPNLAARLY